MEPSFAPVMQATSCMVKKKKEIQHHRGARNNTREWRKEGENVICEPWWLRHVGDCVWRTTGKILPATTKTKKNSRFFCDKRCKKNPLDLLERK